MKKKLIKFFILCFNYFSILFGTLLLLVSWMWYYDTFVGDAIIVTSLIVFLAAADYALLSFSVKKHLFDGGDYLLIFVIRCGFALLACVLAASSISGAVRGTSSFGPTTVVLLIGAVFMILSCIGDYIIYRKYRNAPGE